MTSNDQPLVSVVTPVYNGAEFIAECIESVRAQTYGNWDYTIVNNGSTDATLEIAKRYASTDPRIRVLDNENFLQSLQNHNHALRQISKASRYCKMVFADDWIMPECLEQMVACAEQHPSIGIVGAYGLHGKYVLWTGLPQTRKVVTGRELFVQRFMGQEEGHRHRLYVFGCGTSILFRSDLVRGRDPFFNESDLHADADTCWWLLRGADFGFVHQVLTATREHRETSNCTFSERINTFVAGALRELVTHGKYYLSQEELEFALDRMLHEYYEFLASSILHGRRDPQFWDFHHRSLREITGTFDRSKLTKEIVSKLVNLVLNPKHAIERHLLPAKAKLIAVDMPANDPVRSAVPEQACRDHEMVTS